MIRDVQKDTKSSISDPPGLMLDVKVYDSTVRSRPNRCCFLETNQHTSGRMRESLVTWGLGSVDEGVLGHLGVRWLRQGGP